MIISFSVEYGRQEKKQGKPRRDETKPSQMVPQQQAEWAATP